MIKQYIKQSFTLIKQNRLLSFIAIIGTALAIAMIMCIVLIYQVKTANYEPEVNRDRTVKVGMAIARNKADDGWNNGGRLSLRVVKECFYPLSTAKAVTAFNSGKTLLVSTPGGTTDAKGTVSYTDDTFWKVFHFRFLSGKPYGKEFISGEKKAVVSRSVARKVFGTDDVVGRTLSLSFVDYTICGVVADVSVLAEAAYAEVWVPYTTRSGYESNYSDGLLGSYGCYILAPQAAALDEVRAEAQRNVDRMNFAQKDFKLMLSGAPDTQMMALAREDPFTEPKVSKLMLAYGISIAVLLLVPALNLSGITLSRMRRRMEEIGVRRAFGATRGELLWQVLAENFVITFVGGMLGLVFSYLAVLGMRDWLLNTSMSGYYGVETAVSAGMIVSPLVFVLALFFCLLMNLLSAGIPAYRVSRANIVDALK